MTTLLHWESVRWGIQSLDLKWCIDKHTLVPFHSNISRLCSCANDVDACVRIWNELTSVQPSTLAHNDLDVRLFRSPFSSSPSPSRSHVHRNMYTTISGADEELTNADCTRTHAFICTSNEFRVPSFTLKVVCFSSAVKFSIPCDPDDNDKTFLPSFHSTPAAIVFHVSDWSLGLCSISHWSVGWSNSERMVDNVSGLTRLCCCRRHAYIYLYNPQMTDSSSLSSRCLVALLFSLCLVLVLVLAGLVFYHQTRSPVRWFTQTTTSAPFSSVAKKRQLPDFVNADIDPCEHFYEFVCDKWTRRNKIERHGYGNDTERKWSTVRHVIHDRLLSNQSGSMSLWIHLVDR